MTVTKEMTCKVFDEMLAFESVEYQGEKGWYIAETYVSLMGSMWCELRNQQGTIKRLPLATVWSLIPNLLTVVAHHTRNVDLS